MQFKKSYCLYHTSQIITNFCRDKNCLMPLCPSCIGDHSNYHLQQGTKPQYFNINQTILQTQTILQNTILSIDQDRKRNNQLIKTIQSVQSLIKQKIMNVKHSIYRVVDQSFQQLQKQLKNNLYQVNQDNGLHNIKNSQKLQQKMKDTVNELVNLKDNLKTDKVLGSLIILLKEILPQSHNLHNKMTNYLQKNQNYSPKITINSEIKTSIASNILRLIRIDNKKDLSKSISMSRSIFKNKNQKTPPKDDKVQKAFTPQKSLVYNKNNVLQSSRNKSNITNNSPYRDQNHLPSNKSNYFQIEDKSKQQIEGQQLWGNSRKRREYTNYQRKY